MVLEEECFPHGGYLKHGYGGFGRKDDYYSCDQGYYGNSSSMQMARPNIATPEPIMARPNIATPEPIKHFVVGTESHGHGKESSGGGSYGGKHHHGDRDDHDHDHENYGHGTHHHHQQQQQQQHRMSDAMFGKTSHMEGGYNNNNCYGSKIHGNPNNKPISPYRGGMNHHHGGGGGGGINNSANYEYEREYETYMHKEPGMYESITYDYFGGGRNRCPTPSYYGQQPSHHISNYNNKNHHWAAAKGDAAEWVSKGL